MDRITNIFKMAWKKKAKPTSFSPRGTTTQSTFSLCRTKTQKSTAPSPQRKNSKSLALFLRKSEAEFGRLALQDLKRLRFYTTDYEEDNARLEAINMHYQIVDVIGDGNCGPYIHLIA